MNTIGYLADVIIQRLFGISRPGQITQSPLEEEFRAKNFVALVLVERFSPNADRTNDLAGRQWHKEELKHYSQRKKEGRMGAVWPEKNRQMSRKVALKWFH